jgi:hypothetical protein
MNPTLKISRTIKYFLKEQKMKGKAGIIIITLVSILVAGLVAFNGCKKPTPSKPAAQPKAVEPNKP